MPELDKDMLDTIIVREEHREQYLKEPDRLDPSTMLEAKLNKKLNDAEINDAEKQLLGRKFDQDKPRMELLPPLATLEVAKVLTFGAQKYEPNNWKYVKDATNRYTAGALRHIFATMAQEQLDPESGLDHLAHAICCLMFILEDRLEKSTKEDPRKIDFDQYRARGEPIGSREADN